jgi:glycosyltransferase involved in cell wall biosynthesis
VKVLLVSSHGADLAYGGAERYVAELRDGLERRGEDCVVLSAFPTRADRSAHLRILHDTDWREDRLRRARDHVDSWVAPATARMGATLREISPDLVHTNNLFGITTGIWECARRLGIPVVHTLHDYQLLCPRHTLLRRDGAPCRPHPLLCGQRASRLGRWAPALSRVIGVSAHVLSTHRAMLGSVPGIVVLPPPPRPRASPPTPGPELTTLGFTGALDTHKGIGMLLAAAPRLQQLGVRLRVAGGGRLERSVASVPEVDYAGRLDGDAIGAFIGGCDAGVVPSLWDEPGLTYSALEWLGAGRPVLATARGALAELPGDGVQRLTGTAADLVARVADLHDETRWRRLVAAVPKSSGEGGRDRWIEQHRAVYADALDGLPLPGHRDG